MPRQRWEYKGAYTDGCGHRGRGEAGSARYIEFKVHRSLTDPDRIMGSWRHAHGNRH